MQIKPLFIVILLISFSSVSAQEYTFGVKGGINFNNIGELDHYGLVRGGGVNADPSTDIIYTADKEMGFQFGAFAMIAFDKFFVRPEVMYVSSKNSYPLAGKTSQWTSTKIDIPVLFGYKIYEPVSLYVGPAFSSISSMELEGVEYPILFEKSGINLNAGIMAEYGRFGIDLRYQHGLKKVEGQEVDMLATTYGTNRGRLLEYNPSQIQLSVHINILNINGERRNNKKGAWRGSGCLN